VRAPRSPRAPRVLWVPRIRKDQGGLSLPDLLVSLLLAAILAYIAFLFSSGVGRHYFNLSEKMTQLERATLFERVMERELEQTAPAAVFITPANEAGQTMALQSFHGVVPPGRLRWAERVVVFRHLAEQRQLVLWTTSLSRIGLSGSNAHPQLLPLDQLPDLPILSEDPSYRSWDDMSEFRAERREGSAAVRVTATFEKIGVRQNRHYYRSERVYPVWNNYEP
jgi:hypothetical protein